MKKIGLLGVALALLGEVEFGFAAEERRISLGEFRDRAEAAWIGQIAGVCWGWPTEFRFNGVVVPEDKVPEWKPELINEAFGQDDLYVEMTFLRTLEQYGLNVDIKQAGKDFGNSKYPLWCANKAARDNLQKGIPAPDSGHPKNNKCGNDIDYQIEADFAGIISPGMPNSVIALGEKFGRIMNYGDGVLGGIFMGAMYAEAYFSTNITDIINAGLAAIPAASDYAEVVRSVIAWHAEEPTDWESCYKKLQAKYRPNGKFIWRDTNGNIDVRMNGAIVVMGLLYGNGDLTETMRIAMRGGYDSDCNPSSAGGIVFATKGYRNLPATYTEKLIRKDKKFDFTDYDFTGLMAVTEKLAREIVVQQGGRIEKDSNGTEWFVIPRKAPRVPAYTPTWEATPESWEGKCVVFLGDSITDKRHIGCETNYWGFLAERMGFTAHVYGINGQQANQIPQQLAKAKAELGNNVDTIFVFIGTNDFNGNVPLGTAFNVVKETVDRNGKPTELLKREMEFGNPFWGRMNKALREIKTTYPKAQVVVLTPLHRGYAEFGPKNTQPDERYANELGLFIDDYVRVVREAAALWSSPVIDLYAEGGLLPNEAVYNSCFARGGKGDSLHPSTEGHERLARVIEARLRVIPTTFK